MRPPFARGQTGQIQYVIIDAALRRGLENGFQGTICCKAGPEECGSGSPDATEGRKYLDYVRQY